MTTATTAKRIATKSAHRFRVLANQGIASLLSTVLWLQPALLHAQSVTPDAGAPSANRPGIGAAPNGVPLIDIVTPNGQGLSHNKYGSFNVGEPGLILNNYNGELGTSSLGGLTPGNANLKHSGPAAIILNEVNGGGRSALNGPTEVFGGRADVVIANEHGITCNGCGFINTPHATLTTGVPQIGADGRLNGFTVNGGDISFEGRGGNFAAGAGSVDLFDVISRSVRIDAPVHGKDLRLTAGRNKVDYASGQATALEAITGTPEFAIDGSALGAMQADRIKIVVTEKGAGVRMRGDMAANVGELTLSADGKISIGNASGTQGLNLSSNSGKVEAKRLTSKRKVKVAAADGITLQSVAADDDVSLANSNGLLTLTSMITATGAVTISSGGDIAVNGIEAKEPASLSSLAGNIVVAATARSGGDLNLSAVAGSISTASLVSFANLSLTSGLDITATGDLLAQQALTAKGRSLSTVAIVSGLDIAATAAAGKTVLNGNGDLRLTATHGVKATALTAASELSVVATDIVANTISARGDIDLNGAITLSGQLLSGGNLSATGNGIRASAIASGVDFAGSEAAGRIVVGRAGDLNLNAATGALVAGELLSAGKLTAHAARLEASSVTAHGHATIAADTTVGSALSSGDLIISGRTIKANTLVSGVDFAATTTAGGAIVVGNSGSLTLSASAGAIEAGTLLSAAALSATGQTLTLSNVTGYSDVALAGATTISGQLLGGRHISVSGNGISAGSIVAGIDFAATNAANGAIVLGSAGDLTLDGGSSAIKAGTLLSAGKLSVAGASLDAGSLTAHGNASIAADTTVGTALSSGDLVISGRTIKANTLVSGVDFAATTTAGGAIVVGNSGSLTLSASAGAIEAGTLLSARVLSATGQTLTLSNVTGYSDVALAGATTISGQLLGGRHISVSGNGISAGSIVAGIDFAATSASNGAIVLGSAGDLTLNAGSHDVKTGTLLSAGSLNARAASLDADSITAHGNATIVADTTVGTALSSGDLIISGRTIKANTLVSGVDFAATTAANGAIVVGNSGSLTLSASAGGIEADTLLSAAALSATGQTLNLSNVTAHGDVALAGATTISGQLLGGRHVTIGGGSLKAGAIAAGIDFAATHAANGAIVLGPDGNLTVNAGSGSIEAGALMAAGNIDAIASLFQAQGVTSHGAVSLNANTTVGTILAAGNLSITGPRIRAGNLVSGVDFAATGRSASGDVILGTSGDMTLTATAGNIKAGNLLSAGNLLATARQDITAQAISHGDLMMDAGGMIDLAGQTLSGGDLSLTAAAIKAGTLISGVDFATSEASPSGGLKLKNAAASNTGAMTLTARSGAITAIGLVSAGQLTATADQDLRYDSLYGFADARLASHTGTISIDHTTNAFGNITLEAQSIDLSGNRGRIATAKTVSIIAADADLSQSLYTFGGLDLRLTGTADLTGAALNTITTGGGTGDMSIAAETITTDSQTTLLAGHDLSLTLDRLENAGQIAAGNTLTLDIAGDLVNTPTGLIYASADMRLFARNLVNDQGAILAGSDLTIAGATGAKSDSLSNISGLIQAGGDLSIATVNLSNKRLVNPTWTRDVLVASDVLTGFELNADVAGLPFAFLFGGASDGRELYAGLGPQYWADYEPLLWSEASAADGGSYRAWTWISGSGPQWVGEIGAWIRDRAPKDANGALVLDPSNPSRYFIVQYVNPGADTSTTYSWDFNANLSNTIHEDRLIDAGSPQAMIRAGGNASIDATTLVNSYSAIEASGDMTLTGDSLSNEGLTLNRTTTTTCSAQGACEYFDADGNHDASRDIAAGTSIISRVEAIGSQAGTIRAGGHLDISGFATLSNTAAEGSIAGSVPLAPETTSGDPLRALAGLTAGGALFTPNAAFPGLAVGGGGLTANSGPSVTGDNLTANGTPTASNGGLTANGNPITAGGGLTATDKPSAGPAGLDQTEQPLAGAGGSFADVLDLNGPALAELSKPQSGGFGGTIPGQVFLFETRAQFLDVGKFYGSGYFIDRIGYKPDWRVPFLGDAYFENQLIEQQLRQATGHGLGQGAFLPGSDLIAEMKGLLDRGIDYAKAHGLTLGQPLSAEQIAALDHSIVLYQKQTIQGVEVLAPVLYLAGSDKARLSSAGALIAGNSVSIKAGDIDNSGAFAAVSNLSVSGSNIKATGGGFIAGGNLNLTSSGNLNLTAQTVTIGGQAMVNPTAMVAAGGNAVLSANNALTLKGARVDVGGNATLSGNSVTLDALKVDIPGSAGQQQNATGSSVTSGGSLNIRADSDVNIIGSAARAGGELKVIAEQGSVNIVSTGVAGATSDGYTTTAETRRQQSQLSSGGATTITAGDDILLSGSSINSGADVNLAAGDDVNITAAQETSASQFGKSTIASERHSGSEISADGSIAITSGKGGGDHDLNLIGSKLTAGNTVELNASGDVTIAEARDSETAHLSWNSGGQKTNSHIETQTSVGSAISGGGGVSIASGDNTVISASKIEAGSKDKPADLNVSTGGDLIIASGKHTLDVQQQSSSKGFLSKTSSSIDRYDETTVGAELSASGNVNLNAGGNVAISGSSVDAGKSIDITGDSVSILGAAEHHAYAEEKKKSGLFAGSGDGFVSLWGKEKSENSQTATLNDGSSLSAGDNVSITARDTDINIVGSSIDAGTDISLDAARDVNILAGKEAASSHESEQRSGFGIAYSSGNGSASIGIGYGKVKDELEQSAATNAGSSLSAGRDITINAGRDANLQAATVEAERDVTITAKDNVNLLSAQDTSNYRQMHEELFIGVTAQVSTGLVNAAESVGNAAQKVADVSDGYSAANAGFAGLKAYDAIDSIVNGNVVSGSLTVGFEHSKQTAQGSSSVPVTTDIRAGQSVAIEATSGDIGGHGAQILAGYDANGFVTDSDSDKVGDISLSAGKDILLGSAQASNSSSSDNASAGAGIGIGGGINMAGGLNFGLTGNVHGSKGEADADGTRQVNSHVAGSGDITIKSGNDTTLAGAVVSGDTVTAEVGGDLTIVSVSDTGESSNKSISGGISIGGGESLLSGLQIGGGKGSGSTDWIDEQSGMVSNGKMDVTVGGNTHLDAGKIISESGDLTLSTETLTHENFDGHKQYEGFNATLGIDLTGGKGTPENPVGNNTLEGNYRLDGTRQEVNATVGPGTIEIRDEQKQAALEQDGEIPLDALNRDPDEAYRITRDKHVDVEFYLSTNSVKAVADGVNAVGKSLGTLLADITQGLKANGDLSSESAQRVSGVFEGLENKNLGLEQVLGCTGGKQGFNLLEFFITSAYAEAGGCSYTGRDGKTYQLSNEEFEKCLQILAHGARLRLNGGAAGNDWLPSISEVAGALRKVDQQYGLGDNSVTETALTWSELTHQLTRGGIRQSFGKEALAIYDQYSAEVAAGIGSAGNELDAFLTDWGAQNGYSSSEIADWKYVAAAGLTAAAVIVRAKETGQSIWSNTSKLSSPGNALRHWNDHGREFPGLQNASQYVQAAQNFLNNPPSGTLTKTRPNGDILRYNPATNTFAVMNKNGEPRTMFKPSAGLNYWNKQ